MVSTLKVIPFISHLHCSEDVDVRPRTRDFSRDYTSRKGDSQLFSRPEQISEGGPNVQGSP